MKLFTLTVILLLSVSKLCCQKLLQMDIDKFGGRVSFGVGDLLEFQVDGKKEWYKFTVNDFDFDKQEIIFDELSIPVSRISKLVYIKKGVRKTSIFFGSLFGSFGFPWTVYAIFGLIVGSPMIVPVTFVVGAVAIIFFGYFTDRKAILEKKIQD